MLSQTIFRAYDIRGVVGKEVDAEGARDIGRAFGTYLCQKTGKTDPRAAVGRDNRTHGDKLQRAFIEGLASTGARVTNVGLCPSPLLYFTVTEGDFDGGCNVTASHNPAEYNGFKLVLAEGHAVFGGELQKLYAMIQGGEFAEGTGSVETGGFFERYKEVLGRLFAFPRKLKVVVDTGNGVAGAFYPAAIRAMGHEVFELFSELDGRFPNHQPDPVVEKNLDDLKREVLRVGADVGLAFDGDGDRVGLVDEKGVMHSADQLLMLFSQDALLRHTGRAVVFTVSNSQTLFELVKKSGGRPVMCPVGHSHVEHAMQAEKAIVGGEQSGHFFLPEGYYGFDDALVAGLRLLSIISLSGAPAGSLFKAFPKTFSAPELRPYCPDERKFEIVEAVKVHFGGRYPVVTLDGGRIDFGRGGWAGVRASNTSPCLSVVIEAQSADHLEEISKEVLEHLKTYPGIDWSRA